MSGQESSSEMWNFVQMSPEEVQWGKLREMQRLHHLELDLRGILDTALESEEISDIARNAMNGLTRACINVTQKNDQDGDPVEAVRIQFETPYENTKNELSQLVAPVEVAHLAPGTNTVINRLNGFDSEQIAVAVRMVKEMRQARSDGILPNLKDSLSELDIAIPNDPQLPQAA